MEDHNDKVKVSSRKRSRKPKRLEFVGWGSKNLIEFLESIDRDTTNRISENEVTSIITKYIREKNRNNPSKTKKRKTVDCDQKLHLLFKSKKIRLTKIPELLEKHYVENQDDSDYGQFGSSEDDEEERLYRSDKIPKPVVVVEVQKPKGTFAAIVSDNIKLLYLRKSLVQELAKAPETFESRVGGTFVRIKNPHQLVQVTGVKEGNPIDGCLLEVTNYSYYLKDVYSSALSDDDFSQEECEELHQRIKNGCVKRLTVVDMEEKVRILHEDVTKHWLARELASLQRLINRANEKGWRKQLSQYLDKRELLQNPEEQSRLLREVPEVVAEEEAEPECVDAGEDDFTVPNPEEPLEAHQIDEQQQLSDNDKTRENSIFPDGEDKPTRTASAGNDTTHNKDSITEGEMSTKVTQPQPSVPVIDLDEEPQSQSNQVEIIQLSDDDDEEGKDNRDHQHYDPKKAMWCYEFPKGKTHGPFSLADLKMWSDQEYFVDVPDFKVWIKGESIESAVLLTKVLPHIKT